MRTSNTTRFIRFAGMAAVMLIPEPGSTQIACFNYGQGVISCDSPGGLNATITPLSPGQGVIRYRDSEGSTVMPYTLFQGPGNSRDLNRSIAPLQALPAAPTRSVPLQNVGLPPLFHDGYDPLLLQYRGELPPDLDLDEPPMELR